MASTLQLQWGMLTTVKNNRTNLAGQKSISVSSFMDSHGKPMSSLKLKAESNNVIKARNAQRVRCTEDDGGDHESQPQESSPSKLELIAAEFYHQINLKDRKKVLDMMTNECCYEDLMFYLPFKEKKEIGEFLDELFDAMGKDNNVKFVVEDVTEGKNDTATVIWHLEWRDEHIPFTRGYNYFEFQRDGGELIIRKVRGLEEFPIKPGELMLKLLKIISTLLDNHPTVAKGFLHSNHGAPDMLTLLMGIITLRDHSNISEDNKERNS